MSFPLPASSFPRFPWERSSDAPRPDETEIGGAPRRVAEGNPAPRVGTRFLVLFSIPLISVLAYPLFFHGLAERDLWSSHEGRAAQNAQSILDTGDWLLPRLADGRIEMQKPPLYYWLVAVAGWLRGQGVDAWAVRLPSALSALGGMALVFVLLWRRGRPLAGLLAALILGTMLHYTWLGRTGRIDMPMALCVAAALAGFYLGRHALSMGKRVEGRSWQALGYLGVAVGVMLKGPIAFVLPLCVIAFFLVGCPLFVIRSPLQKATSPQRTSLWWGLPLVALLTLPWFLWASRQTDGEFVREFILRHNLLRGLGGDERLEGHPWWHYGPRLLGDLFPWSLLLPAVVFHLARKGGWRTDAEARFGLIWLGVVVLFLSCLRFKRADYLLPAYPGAAILLACVLERWIHELRRRGRRVALASLGATVLACAGGWIVFVERVLPRWEPRREQHTFAEQVRRLVPRPALVLLFRTESHTLVHHLGRSFDRIMEWENLDYWASRPAPVFVVMPPMEAAEQGQHLGPGRLYPVWSNSGMAGAPHKEPLVLLCNRPGVKIVQKQTRY